MCFVIVSLVRVVIFVDILPDGWEYSEGWMGYDWGFWLLLVCILAGVGLIALMILRG